MKIAAVIDDFSLWNEYDEGGLTQKTGAEGFDRDHFIHWLRTNRFIQKKDDGYVLTEKGKTLSLESSMLPAIEQLCAGGDLRPYASSEDIEGQRGGSAVSTDQGISCQP